MPKSKRQQSLPGWEDEQSPPDVAVWDASAAGDPNSPPWEEPNPTVAATNAPLPPPDNLRGKSVWVIDSFSLIFQVFHALPEMTSPGGQPVGAVFGFTRDILY